MRIPYRDWCPLSEGDSCLTPAELQCCRGSLVSVPGCMVLGACCDAPEVS